MFPNITQYDSYELGMFPNITQYLELSLGNVFKHYAILLGNVSNHWGMFPNTMQYQEIYSIMLLNVHQ